MSFTFDPIGFFKKIWFPTFILIIILIYFFYDKKISIIILIIAISILTIEIIYESLITRKFARFLKKFGRIDDITIAKKLNKDIFKIKDKMSKLMHEGKISGKIIAIKNTYIYYNKKMIEILKEILVIRKEEFGDALRVLSKHGFSTKSELKIIREELSK